MEILKSHADKFELDKIDEAYLDISDQVKDFEEAREFAKRLTRLKIKSSGEKFH